MAKGRVRPGREERRAALLASSTEVRLDAPASSSDLPPTFSRALPKKRPHRRAEEDHDEEGDQYSYYTDSESGTDEPAKLTLREGPGGARPRQEEEVALPMAFWIIRGFGLLFYILLGSGRP